jgi:hypothetical protein
MPYYCSPRVASQDVSFNPASLPDSPSDANAAHHLHCQSIMAAIFHHNCHGLSHFSNVSVHFGNFDSVTPNTSHALFNHKIPTYVHQIHNFNWAVYSFGGGHFASTILSLNLPFHVKLACDQYESGRALF